MQQGDNGQSIVLGGMTPDGRDGYNMLSEMCLRASAELRLIDPKINLRVNRDTPLSVYELGTRLTRLGLGFPQYENDDVAIPALEALGYEERDARDYAMAACWEFIIPGKGMEIPNIDAMPFANSVDQVKNSRSLVRVDVLPYQRAAGAKYEMVGREYAPGFDESVPPRFHTEIFDRMGIPYRVF